MNLKVTLDQEEVEEIIKEHLSKKFKIVNSVKLTIGTGIRGYGMNEYKTAIFEGAVCEVEM